MTNLTELNSLLKQLAVDPILIDIGASGSPPEIWQPLGPYATYIGFDPDRREVYEDTSGHFARSIIINQAVMAAPGDVRFFLTRSPFCSSTLPPNAQALSDYIFAELFVVEDQVTAPATTLNQVAQELDLPTIDWIKADSQGIDLQIYASMADTLREKLLAIDIEPGLMNAYVGEDLFPELHRRLTQEGFWLSDLTVRGTVRMRTHTRQELQTAYPELTVAQIEQRHKMSPGWVEARYLRTLDWLAAHHHTPRAYRLLWVFALMDGQIGYALDIAAAYATAFEADPAARLMHDEPIRLLQALITPVPPPPVPTPSLARRLARRLKRAIR